VKVHAKFVTSAAAASQFPEPGAPEIAFLGRSNVGKSSLLNSLVGGKLAHVSSSPGRTRTINFFSIAHDAKHHVPEMMLVDLPGYGYAKISKSLSAEWPKFIDPYLKERPTLALCVALVDLNVPAQDSDATLLAFLRAVGRNFVVVGTKADKLSNNQLRNAARKLAGELGIEEILPYSAKTHAGREELWRAIKAAIVL
jgi:GTP-binding protein